MLYLKEYLIYQISLINLCVANYRTEARVEKLFNYLNSFRPDYISFCNLVRLEDLYTNCNIMCLLAIQPDTFYTNSLKYVSSDFIKNVYLWFRGNRYDNDNYFPFIKKCLNYSYNILSEDIIKNYLTNFKEVLKKYGYKF